MIESGTVLAFDDHRGLGTIIAGDGRSFLFHCTSIAGGSRTIEQGARVNFEVVPGNQGQWEAAAVTPC